MKNTKKIVATLAIFGACIGLNAQTYHKTKNEGMNHKTGITETTYEKTPIPQDKTTVVVPEVVKAAFNKDYYTRDISPTWKKEGENYRVSFTNASISSVALYSKSGKLIETDRQLGDNEYPAEIANYCSKNHNNVIVWAQDRGGVIKYFTRDKEDGQITWFDKDGNHIKGTGHNVHHTTKSVYK
ncbi:MAG TPA: hypothetical protein VNZ49_15120 [Bacteroidia bacterium]|jgi:hypothetical protein|nr:hypothetical protein [Bacteroidia bacterium]